MARKDNLVRKLISNELKFCRQEKGLTTSETSELSGISASTICYYENAKGSLNIDVITTLLEVYDISCENFFSRIIAKMRES